MSFKLGNKGIFVIIIAIIIALIIDTSITRISVFTGGLRSSSHEIAVFAAMVVIYAIGQHVILEFVKPGNKKISEQLYLVLTHKLVRISQYVLIALLIAIVLQIVFTSSYSMLLLKAIIWINYVMSIILLGLLAQKFFSWSRSNRNAVVISYAIAMAMLSLSAAFTILYITNELTGQRDIENIRPLKSVLLYVSNAENIFSSTYIAISVVSFILTWFATVLLMHHYSKRLGSVKYWIIVSIPLVYFLSQFQSLFVDVFIPLRASDPIVFGVVYTLIFSAIKPVGGVLFGIAFWSVARSLTNEMVKGYMMISAFGMMLLFTSNQPVGLTLLPFPPFGLVTICFMGLASYLVFLGIYSSAISISQDSSLRRSIRKYAITESKLLDSIGSAQMEQEIQKRVIELTRQNHDILANETGIEPSLNEDEAKEYLHEVLKEVRKGKMQNDDK